MVRYEDLLIKNGIDYIKNVPASRISTYKGGGRVAILALPKYPEQLKALPPSDCFILGAGSNTLINDGLIDNKPVICTRNLQGLSIRGNRITLLSGTKLSRVAIATEQAELSGFERLFGIPGSIGGAIKMNAGAFDLEMSNLVSNITVFDIKSSAIYTIATEDIPWEHRSTGNIFDGKIIVSATFNCVVSNASAIRKERLKYIGIRKALQPLEPSLGSAFKRISKTESASFYLDKAGLKGHTCGGARISEKHAGFIVNAGTGTASDYLKLMNTAKDRVKSLFGIELQPEIEVIDNESIQRFKS